MSRAIYARRLVRENSKFYRVSNKQNNESNTLDRPDGVTNKKQVRKS